MNIKVNFSNGKVSTWTFIDCYYVDYNKCYISFKDRFEEILIPFDNVDYFTTER